MVNLIDICAGVKPFPSDTCYLKGNRKSLSVSGFP